MEIYTSRHLSRLTIALISILSLVLLITTLAIGLRLWARIKTTRRLLIDDYFLLASHLVNVMCIGTWFHVHIEQYKYEPRSSELFCALSLSLLLTISTYVFASLLVKVAIGLFFLRIAQSKWQKYLVLVPTTIYAVCILVSLTIVLFRCGVPIIPAQILGSDSDSCPIGVEIEQALGLNIASLNALCDWLYAAIPIYMLLKSERLDRATKISSCFVIGIAILGSVISLIRLPYFIGIEYGEKTFESHPIVSFLSILESSVAAIAISLATLKPLLILIRSKFPKENKGHRDMQHAEHRPHRFGSPWRRPAPKNNSTGHATLDVRIVRGIGILPDATTGKTNSIKIAEDNGLVIPMDENCSGLTIRTVFSVSEVLHEARQGLRIIFRSGSDRTIDIENTPSVVEQSEMTKM